jgi:predicted nucleic acid-binding protein
VGEAAVVNASPLIHLSRAGYLSLLEVTGSTVVVPAPVAEEIRAKGAVDVTAQAIEGTPWLEVVPAPAVPQEIAAWDLGPGESSVLAWAHLHQGSVAILDDLQGRRCALALHIPLLGTLGVVLTAKRRGLVPAARPILEKLIAHGMYLSGPIVDQALALVGE